METKYDGLVNDVIDEADIILMILDARKVLESINTSLEEKIKEKGKILFYVINKCDLLSKTELAKIGFKNSMKVSAINHTGTMKLLRKIMEISHGEEVTVGIVGYPNTGKSTLINSLKGRHSAPTSSVSGYTKALQKIRVSDKVMLIDTPGVLNYADTKTVGLQMIGAIDAHKIKDPEIVATDIILELNGRVQKYFGLEEEDEPEEVLAHIAAKTHMLLKGGYPDTIRAAKEVIRLCQEGKIK